MGMDRFIQNMLVAVDKLLETRWPAGHPTKQCPTAWTRLGDYGSTVA
ncbi:hypothetical protein FHS63_001267 [Azospirillum doebereinerae]